MFAGSDVLGSWTGSNLRLALPAEDGFYSVRYVNIPVDTLRLTLKSSSTFMVAEGRLFARQRSGHQSLREENETGQMIDAQQPLK